MNIKFTLIRLSGYWPFVLGLLVGFLVGRLFHRQEVWLIEHLARLLGFLK